MAAAAATYPAATTALAAAAYAAAQRTAARLPIPGRTRASAVAATATNSTFVLCARTAAPFASPSSANARGRGPVAAR